MDSKEVFVETPSISQQGPSSEKPAIGLGSLETRARPSRGRTVFLISTLTATVLVGSMNTGITTVSLPRIAKDLNMPSYLLLWPALVYSLASGCTMLLAGAIADIAGSRVINLGGTFVLSIFILASGLARTGIQLLLFRAFQGIGVAMCFPTAVSILSATFPSGRVRSLSFASLGLGTPFGFSVGLLLGGFFESTAVGWRLGYYVCAGATMVLFAVNCWFLPQDREKRMIVWSQLRSEIDWIGLLISSTSLGLMSYVFAMITGSLSSVHEPANITLLSVSAVLIPLFVIWMHIQESRGKPALIPNSVWKNAAFSTICIMVLLSWASLQSMEWFLSLFFQQIQLVSPIGTSVRFLPNVIFGSILNITTGLIVHRVPVNFFVVLTSAICAISPLLMALINPAWSWWWCAFWAMLLLPLSIDVIFTVASLIITDVFPPRTQALAGAVFNTVAQLGTSVGIAIMAVISASVTNGSSLIDKKSPEALMQGYRAAFWACFALMVMMTLVGMWGLRKVTKLGTKSDA